MAEKIRIEVMANGLPGKMGTIVANGLLHHERYSLSLNALTGPNMPKQIEMLEGGPLVDLIEPEIHEKVLEQMAQECALGTLYAIDFCKGAGVAVRNAGLYCATRRPFVMGSTIMGAEAKAAYAEIERMAEESHTPCVVAPNFDVRLNAWMYGLEAMAKGRPGAFTGAKIYLLETHQADKIDKKTGKPETSGTMRAELKGLSLLTGRAIVEADITCVRDPAIQSKLLGVPENWMSWHAYHFLKVFNEHDGVEDSEELIFKRHGGDSYRVGAMLALDWLVDGKNKKYYNTMTDDVLGAA